MRAAWRRFLLALSFLTIVPVAAGVSDPASIDVAGSAACFPLVGGLLGLALWGTTALLSRVLPQGVSAAVALGLYTLVTGALHADGLMDTADAVGSRGSLQRALAIMQDPHSGAMGVTAAILVYLGKFEGFSHLPLHAAGIWVAAPVLSRWGMVLAMRIAPSARGNQGLAGSFAGCVPWGSFVAAFGTALVFTFAGNSAVVALLLVTSTTGLAVAVTRWFHGRFGGMTGDTYGALNEILEWWGWLFGLALSLHR